MVIFPKLFLTILIAAAILFVAVGAVTLIVLLFSDIKGGKVW